MCPIGVHFYPNSVYFQFYTGTCKLGEWSEWTSCDCDTGARKRVREVFVPPGVSPVNCHAHRVEHNYECTEECKRMILTECVTIV